MALWLNLIGYQAVWFAAVMGAGQGLTWPAVIAAGVFVALQLAWSRQWRADLWLVLAALVCGLLLDGALTASGLLRHTASSPALPPGGAPVWILAVWIAFALTLNHSMGWLRRRPVLAWLAGAVGGPLAYWGAARGWRAVIFETPVIYTVAWLSAGWSIALVLLATVARHMSDEQREAAA